jgi:futalosine hydrolase
MVSCVGESDEIGCRAGENTLTFAIVPYNQAEGGNRENMLLLTVATEKEIEPLKEELAAIPGVALFVTGMGPVAAAASLGSYLGRYGDSIKGVLNIGVAGAYPDSGPTLLDLCLARQEVLGDFGICMAEGMRDFDPEIAGAAAPLLFDNELVLQLKTILQKQGADVTETNFVTVNCCSGTTERGRFLQDKFGAGCENMEGAAVAMACSHFAIPCAELRCVSNMVEERDTGKWQLAEAVEKICGATRIFMREYVVATVSGP